MHHYRQALLRMRQGDSDREIATARVMGRRKAAHWREVAGGLGWLNTDQPLPEDEAIAHAMGAPRRASTTVSTLESHRERLTAWVEQGVSGAAMHAALQRQHGWTGSYSAVRRLVGDIRRQLPPETTCRLEFEPADAAQVDFGAGPMLLHPDGNPRRTWAFVMTLAHSRHQYVEFVWDQTVATWLGCHRRAFEWFVGVPARIIIDNAKCAIVKACQFDPTVQRAYASGIAGEIPPDQSLPEVWVLDDDRLEAARKALDELTHQPWKHWTCAHCGEQIEGPFEQCWQCGAPRPPT